MIFINLSFGWHQTITHDLSAAIWINLDLLELSGAIRCDHEPTGAVWSHLDLCGANWRHLEPSGADWQLGGAPDTTQMITRLLVPLSAVLPVGGTSYKSIVTFAVGVPGSVVP